MAYWQRASNSTTRPDDSESDHIHRKSWLKNILYSSKGCDQFNSGKLWASWSFPCLTWPLILHLGAICKRKIYNSIIKLNQHQTSILVHSIARSDELSGDARIAWISTRITPCTTRIQLKWQRLSSLSPSCYLFNNKCNMLSLVQCPYYMYQQEKKKTYLMVCKFNMRRIRDVLH